MKTFREKLAETYPLHFQRILELTHEHYSNIGFGYDAMLNGPALRGSGLSSCFIWVITDEGHSYWSSLSHAERSHEG